MIVDQVKINIDEKNQTYTHYKSFSKFKKGKSNYTSKNREGFQCKSSIIKHDLNAILSEVNYIDTSNTIFKNSYNSVKINTEIVSVETYGITLAGSYIKLKARLSLHEFGSEKELYTREIESTSEYDEFPTESSFCSLTASALKNILYEFLEDEGVRPFLKSQEEQYAQSFQEMDTLSISNADFARNKQEALNAVVTIQKGNSHGSGCIISSDGYIISNLHVTSDDDTQLKVILEGGEERTCRFIRSNPVYDLVLLKIDPVSIKPLKVNSSREISIGEVVFAIGTPADIELGQSITKGIISGKRINNEQVIIQTDVSVNPGNSGGALINSEGELLGVINAKIFGAGIEGLGFAIPAYYIEEALKIEFE